MVTNQILARSTGKHVKNRSIEQVTWHPDNKEKVHAMQDLQHVQKIHNTLRNSYLSCGFEWSSSCSKNFIFDVCVDWCLTLVWQTQSLLFLLCLASCLSLCSLLCLSFSLFSSYIYKDYYIYMPTSQTTGRILPTPKLNKGTRRCLLWTAKM